MDEGDHGGKCSMCLSCLCTYANTVRFERDYSGCAYSLIDGGGGLLVHIYHLKFVVFFFFFTNNLSSISDRRRHNKQAFQF